MAILAIVVSTAALSAAPPTLESFKTRVAAEIARHPELQLPSLASVRESFMYLRASDYMKGKDPRPSAHELRIWIDAHGHETDGLLLAQEVASGWTTSHPSPPESFPEGTPPETVERMRALEQRAWVEAVISGLGRTQHPLAPEAMWHAMWARDADDRLRDIGFYALSSTYQETAVDVLVPCIEKPPVPSARLRCAAALGHQHVLPAVEALVGFLKSRDPELRRAAIEGLGYCQYQVDYRLAPPTEREARGLAAQTLIPLALDPTLVDDPTLTKALSHVEKAALRQVLEPELDKPHSPRVKLRIKDAITNGADRPPPPPHAKW
jgi:hypothetical protein